MIRRLVFVSVIGACLLSGCSDSSATSTEAPAVEKKSGEATTHQASNVPPMNAEQKQRGDEMARGYSAQYGAAAQHRPGR